MKAFMQPIRSLARPLVALPFVVTGLETLRDPRARAEQVAPTVKTIADRVDWLPTRDPVALVRIEGALSLSTGALLALGRFKRLTTLLLTVQLVPSLLTEHRYWTEDDPERRTSERSHLLKNVSLFGALLSMTTEPRRRSALARRARDARIRAGAETRHLRKHATAEAKKLAKR
ncbi:MAG: DoxX family protein [Streptosporangiaceae bacterium]|jgi:uncharacterized membrane protein YphA (DoxX/SURF4 family)|nr:DoxX family protein [Streptosporangiaceae bacterium]